MFDGHSDLTFTVRVNAQLRISAASIAKMVDLIGKPRPGREYSVREIPNAFAVEVIYVRHPDAPAFVVSYTNIAQAWGQAVEDRDVDMDPGSLPIGAALMVMDIACDHVRADR